MCKKYAKVGYWVREIEFPLGWGWVETVWVPYDVIFLPYKTTLLAYYNQTGLSLKKRCFWDTKLRTEKCCIGTVFCT